MDSDLRRLVRELKKQGFTVETTTKGHIRVLDANGSHVTITAGTPSDYRSRKNFLAELRRAGFIWQR